MKKKYSWFNNHEEKLSFTVKHTENDVETIIAATDSAEKADLIEKALNQFDIEKFEAANKNRDWSNMVSDIGTQPLATHEKESITNELIRLIDDFINQNGLWFSFKGFIEAQGYTPTELGFVEE